MELDTNNEYIYSLSPSLCSKRIHYALLTFFQDKCPVVIKIGRFHCSANTYSYGSAVSSIRA